MDVHADRTRILVRFCDFCVEDQGYAKARYVTPAPVSKYEMAEARAGLLHVLATVSGRPVCVNAQPQVEGY